MACKVADPKVALIHYIFHTFFFSFSLHRFALELIFIAINLGNEICIYIAVYGVGCCFTGECSPYHIIYRMDIYYISARRILPWPFCTRPYICVLLAYIV